MVIQVKVRDKIACLVDPDARFVCGNSDIVIAFDFDEEWEAYDTKTVRFIYNGLHVDKVFTGKEVEAPIINNTNLVKVGVFAGNLHTTTPAYIRALKSITDENGMPVTPAPDVYAQIMELLNQEQLPDGQNIFSSFAEANAAAAAAGPIGGESAQYYYGQQVAVVSGAKAILYIIQPDNTLQQVGTSYNVGSGLKYDAETNMLSVDTAETMEQDNTKPITSAAVYTEVGNINALLKSI